MYGVSLTHIHSKCRLSSTNAAPSLGPVLSGILAQRLGWRWIFWVLTILSGLTVLSFLLFFPETARILVGNGSKNTTSLLVFRAPIGCSLRTRRNEEAPKRSLVFPNPLACLRVLWNRNTACVILVGSIFYTVFCCLGASLSTLCIRIYDLNYLEAGLVYLPSGIGGIIAAYTAGMLVADFVATAFLYQTATYYSLS